MFISIVDVSRRIQAQAAPLGLTRLHACDLELCCKMHLHVPQLQKNKS
jgi:hypothetical protein